MGAFSRFVQSNFHSFGDSVSEHTTHHYECDPSFKAGQSATLQGAIYDEPIKVAETAIYDAPEEKRFDNPLYDDPIEADTKELSTVSLAVSFHG